MNHELSIFFDTEFTDFDKCEIISLGAVTADGNHNFYGEVDPIPFGCSEFVIENVLPILTGTKFTKDELKIKFLIWLSSFDCDIELCSDHSVDRDIVYKLCGYPIQLSGNNICTWFPLPMGVPNNPHHALKDAQMLREKFEEYFC
jgi:DNA polymerase III epsilon subunit-like protein